jgi:hypothetical protein
VKRYGVLSYALVFLALGPHGAAAAENNRTSNNHAGACLPLVDTLLSTPSGPIYSHEIRGQVKPIGANGLPEGFDPLDAERFPKGFDVVALLGSGGEGHVYVVRHDGKLECLKVFDTSDLLKDNLTKLKMLHDRGLSTPKILEVNENARWVRLEYIKGIPLDMLKKVGKLPEDEAYRVRQILQAATATIPPDLRRGISPFNTLYDFEHDRIVVIDPN